MSIGGFKSGNHPQQVAKRGADDAVDDMGTRPEVFGPLSERFGGFTLDVAAAAHNAKCERFYAREDDGLTQPWMGRVWCNPPYSDLRSWVEKAWFEWRHGNGLSLIVMLVPANRTEQGWWQDLIEQNRSDDGPLRVEFLRGRMRFDRPQAVISKKGDRPPFGCCLLIWDAVNAAAPTTADPPPQRARVAGGDAGEST